MPREEESPADRVGEVPRRRRRDRRRTPAAGPARVRQARGFGGAGQGGRRVRWSKRRKVLSGGERSFEWRFIVVL